MCLLAYRSAKHEVTGLSPAELYFARDLRLPIDLLRGSPPRENNENINEGYAQKLKGKLDEIHCDVRRRMNLQSSRIKDRYDQKARRVNFDTGQDVWFFNPRRERGKAPKLQNNWEGPFRIVKKLSEVVFKIRKSDRHRCKVVHADRLAPFIGRNRT